METAPDESRISDDGLSVVTTSATPASDASLTNEDFPSQLRELRRLDNITNWFYIARAWLFIAAVIAAAVFFSDSRATWGMSWWWNVPVFALAIVCIGAGQHQLGGATHEATHHILFRNRWLNELASDLLCIYPLFSTTYQYRLQHLGHHNFVNDPRRDPDCAQLAASGHEYEFPLEHHEFLLSLLKNLWPPKLIRYMRERGKISVLGSGGSPYLKTTPSLPAWRKHLPVLFFIMQAVTVAVTWRFESPVPLATVPAIVFAAAVTYLFLIPQSWFLQSRLRPVIPFREAGILRAAFTTFLLTAIGWGNRAYGASYPAVGAYFALLWLTPILTSFAYFMILRQVIQHGNGDRGWLTNTRVFFVNPAINFAVFPFGMQWHLPHHMYATVPHYRLPELHALLQRDPAYRESGLVVEGYLLPRRTGQETPTVIEVLGPKYARHSDDVFIDDDVLIYDEVETMAANRPPIPPHASDFARTARKS